MTIVRSIVGVVIFNGRFYVVGGRDGFFCLNLVERYDFYINKWLVICLMFKRRGGKFLLNVV